VATCLRLHRQTRRENLRLAFNLCHFLKQNDPDMLETTLKLAAPRLRMVSINGADRGDTRRMNWDRLIQPLGKGSFPVAEMLRILEEIGYDGPVGLQCYGIREPARQHLADSMQAWSGLTAGR